MKLKSNKAFTLVELLVALSITSIISMAFFSFLNSSIKFNSKNETDINALNIAQSEIEKLRKQIKSNYTSSNIYIQVNENEHICIGNNNYLNDNISWVREKSNKNIEYINIPYSSRYSNYIEYEDDDINNNPTIKYGISKNKNTYFVNLNIKREKIGSKYLYKIKIRINNENNKFSNKFTELYTEILSK